MVPVLVLLTFVALVALDYLVISKRYQELAGAGAGPGPPWAVPWQPVPEDIFLQPDGTFSRIGDAGEVYVGVHPMLLGLVGRPLELDCHAPGDRLAKGEPLVRMSRAGRHLTVRSPLSGRVELVNYPALGGSDSWPWLYRLAPEKLAAEQPAWMSGGKAAEFTRRRYGDIIAYLQGAAGHGHLGTLMADGGEPPAGILGELDQSVWAGLEERFLTPAGEHLAAEDRP